MTCALMNISIIIPSFNEGQNVVTLATRIQTALQSTNLAYDICFIDDSTDNTPFLLAELSAAHTNIHFIHRAATRGLGSAVVAGFQHATGDYLIVMDADLQHPPELLPQIIAQLQQGADLVIPSRFIAGGSDGGLNIFRKLVSWVARGIGRLLIEKFRRLSDCTGGYFGLKRRVIEDVKLNPLSWKILMEVIVKGKSKTITEIPYHFVARGAGHSKMSLREQWNYLRHVMQLYRDGN